MLAFILRRLAAMVIVLWAVFTITFFVVYFGGGDPFLRERSIPETIVKQMRARYKVDGPWYSQYSSYLADVVLRGDLRLSLKFRDRSVNDLLADTLPVSTILGAAALFIAVCGGVWLGTLAAVRQHTAIDAGAMFMALALISIPTFVVGPLLILIFGLWLRWLPVGGWNSWTSILLPAITLAGPYVAYIARLMRSSLLETLTQDYIRTARAKGLDEARTVYRHAMKVALLPVVSYIGPLAAYLLTGSLIVETIFNIPGAGPFFVQSILNNDQFLLMGVTIVYCSAIVILNFLTDISYTWLDRRISLHE
jgi:oligopeptide transport system permease protein